jgi:4Fe-4S ferredoxin
LKNENENQLVIEMVLHSKRFSLTLDKEKCRGCGICMEICPREAIQVSRTPKTETENGKKSTVKIIEEKCHFCGICEALCIFGALKTKIDGKPVIPVVEKESFPKLIREIKIDGSKCGPDCLQLEEICPLNLIQVTAKNSEGKKGKETNFRELKDKLKIKVEIEKESCPCCRICETKFPKNALNIKKIFYGNLKINNEKCPEGCHYCKDVCPFPGVLYISNGKVQVNESNCVYCGCCKIACPEEDALELTRSRIRHTTVRSGAWNNALQKLGSTSAVIKEIECKNAKKLKNAVFKRFPPEEFENDG